MCIKKLRFFGDCTYLAVGTVFFYLTSQDLPQSWQIAICLLLISVLDFFVSLYLDFLGVNAHAPKVMPIMALRPRLLPARVTTLFFLTSALPLVLAESCTNSYPIFRL